MVDARRKSGAQRGTATSTKLLSQIQQGKLAPVYLLHGPERYARDEALQTILDAAVDPVSRAFNLDVLHADDLDVADAVSRASAYPMMGPRRAVVIKNAERLDESAVEAFLDLVRRPQDTTVLVFTASSIDRRKRLFAELVKSAVCIEFRAPYQNQVPDWIRGRARALGKQIDPDAVHLLQLSAGSQPADLANEIEKLAVCVGDRESIGADDVRAVVGATKGASVFDLAEAVFSRNAGRAFTILKHLEDQGEQPVGAVAILIRHVGILRKARWLQSARLPKNEMAGRLKVPPYFVPRYLDQASLFEDEDLWRAYQALLVADNRLKLRSRKPYVTLSQLVWAICCPEKPREGRGRLDKIGRTW